MTANAARAWCSMVCCWLWGVTAVAQPAMFPEDSEYLPVRCGVDDGSGTIVYDDSSDPLNDESGAQSERDIVGGAGEPAYLYVDDGTHLFLRIRVQTDPGNFDPFGWGYAIDLDGDLESFELLFILDGRGQNDEMRLDHNSVQGNLNDPSDAIEDNLRTYAVADYARATPAADSADPEDYFITMALPLSHLMDPAGDGSVPGVTNAPVRFWPGTGANGQRLDADIACHDANGNAEPLLNQILVEPTVVGTDVTILSPTDGSNLGVTPTFTGTAEIGATLTATLTPSGGSAQAPVAVTIAADGTWSFMPSTDLALGDWSLQMDVSDGTSMDSDSLDFTVVATNTISITSPTNGSTLSAYEFFPVAATDAGMGTTVTFQLFDSGDNPLDSCMAAVDGSGEASCTDPLTVGAGDDYRLRASVSNGGGGTASSEIVFDATPVGSIEIAVPVGTLDSQTHTPQGTTNLPKDTVLTAIARPANGTGMVSMCIATVVFQRNAPNTWQCETPIDTGTDGDFALDVSGLAPLDVSVDAMALFSVESTAHRLTFETPADGFTGPEGDVVPSGTTNLPPGTIVSVDVSPNGGTSLGTCMATVQPRVAGNTWACDVGNGFSLLAGDYLASANAGGVTGQSNFSLQGPPTLNFVEPLDGSMATEGDVVPSGTTDLAPGTNVTVSVAIEGGGEVGTCDAEVATGNGLNTWACEVGDALLLTPGTYVATASANMGTVTGESRFTLLAAPRSLSITSPATAMQTGPFTAAGSSANVPQSTLVTVTIRDSSDNPVSSCMASVDATGAWSCPTPIVLPEGTGYTLIASVPDGSGTVTVEHSFDVTVVSAFVDLFDPPDGAILRSSSFIPSGITDVEPGENKVTVRASGNGEESTCLADIVDGAGSNTFVCDSAIGLPDGVGYTVTASAVGPGGTVSDTHTIDVAARDSDGDTVPDVDDLDDDGDGIPDADEGEADADQDGDGVPNRLDLDSDNDGIPDVIEAGGEDSDGDGMVDDFNDADNNGLDDILEDGALPLPDTDGDGLRDIWDLDSDADGISDLIEGGGTDADGDGTVDDFVDDTPMDGWHDDLDGNNALPLPDSDGDGDADYVDVDSDDDGVPDSTEGHDDDADGVPDTFPTGSDGDGDGLDDAFDSDAGGAPAPIPDHDDDGNADYVDPDDDGDGRSTVDERADAATHAPPDGDVDMDGIPSYLDPDSDGDGASDASENSDGGDVNDDGLPDYLDPDFFLTDTDGDGIPDDQEAPGDSDGDGIPNVEDPDDDGDGVPTAEETSSGGGGAGSDLDKDTDGDGTRDYLDTDDDGDGIPTEVERPGDQDVDTDGDGLPDFLDPDDDDDGLPTTDERPDGQDIDTDGDGTPNHLDPDDDGDGVPTEMERPDSQDMDTDGDGTPDHLDLDDDDDGIPTSEEQGDTDGDGIPDRLDPDGIGVAGGAGCQAGDSSLPPGGWLALLLWLGLHVRRRRMTVLGAALLLSVGGASQAHAQEGFSLNRYRAAETARDGFSVSRPNALEHRQVSLQMQFDYMRDPLVVELRPGDRDSEAQAIVADQLTGHLVAAVGLWDRAIFYGGLPVILLQQGDDVGTLGLPNADGSGPSDVWLGARVRILGDEDSIFSLGAQASLTLPLAQWLDSNQAYSGSQQITGVPELLAEVRVANLRITGNLGAQLSKSATLGNVELSHDVLYALGLTLDVHENVALSLESFGSTNVKNAFGREETPLEVLAGGKYIAPSGWVAGLAVGPGLGRGTGAPDVRVIGMIGLSTTESAPPPPPKAPPAPPPPSDSDGDGLPDTEDACPSEPEDRDTFEDEDGCPDLDNDDDGVSDAHDGCPMEPEDEDSFADDDGCPDPDNDEDGVFDTNDKCPAEAEDQDGFADDDGCPDPDNDKDGVLDADDECPTAPGKPEAKGCPKAVRVEDGLIRILDRVEFATNRAKILKASRPILEEVSATIRANPQITRIRVEGHTDDRGSDKHNLELSRKRAEAVNDWLVQSGVETTRLGASGCGETQPIESNKKRSGRQTNRRVEFHIVANDVEGFGHEEGCTGSQ